MKTKFVNKVPGGFRIGRLEVYRIIGKPDFGVLRGSCQCLIVSLGWFGFTWLSPEFECYQKAWENEPPQNDTI